MSEFRLSVPIVINRCYGGFSLSPEAHKAIAKRKGQELYSPDHGGREDSYNMFIVGSEWKSYNDLNRNDPDLIAVVKELGKKANGECADLRVVTVDITIDIDNFDGKENAHVSGYVNF